MLSQKSSQEFEREVLLYSTRTDTGLDMENALICGTNSSWLVNGSSKCLHVLPVQTTTSLTSTASMNLQKPGSWVWTWMSGYIQQISVQGSAVGTCAVDPQERRYGKDCQTYLCNSVLVLLLAASVIITFFSQILHQPADGSHQQNQTQRVPEKRIYLRSMTLSSSCRFAESLLRPLNSRVISVHHVILKR